MCMYVCKWTIEGQLMCKTTSAHVRVDHGAYVLKGSSVTFDSCAATIASLMAAARLRLTQR